MKFRKNLWVSASLIALMSQGAIVSAHEAVVNFQPRQVSQVESEIVKVTANKLTYTVKEGDTLSIVAKAMKLNLERLADINTVANIELMTPGNQFKVELNHAKEAVSLEVKTIDGAVNTYDLTKAAQTAHVVVDQVAEYVEPAEQEVLAAETPAPVTEVATEAPVVETQAIAVAPVTEVVTEVPATTEVISETPVSQAVSEVLSTEVPVTEVPVTEAVTTQAPVTTQVPVTTQAPVTTEAVTQAPAQDPYSNPENAGLDADAAAYKEKVGAQFGVEDYSLYRAGDPGDHGTGNAVDFMVYGDSAKGDAIADYSINNMQANNIKYVIWQQQIYGDWTNGQWQAMEDRGGVTANHYDHVHVSFN